MQSCLRSRHSLSKECTWRKLSSQATAKESRAIKHCRGSHKWAAYMMTHKNYPCYLQKNLGQRKTTSSRFLQQNSRGSVISRRRLALQQPMPTRLAELELTFNQSLWPTLTLQVVIPRFAIKGNYKNFVIWELEVQWLIYMKNISWDSLSNLETLQYVFSFPVSLFGF